MMHHSRRFIQIPTNIYTVLEKRHNGAKEIREEKGCNKKRRWKGKKQIKSIISGIIWAFP
jgi:hypothetical protein